MRHGVFTYRHDVHLQRTKLHSYLKYTVISRLRSIRHKQELLDFCLHHKWNDLRSYYLDYIQLSENGVRQKEGSTENSRGSKSKKLKSQ